MMGWYHGDWGFAGFVGMAVMLLLWGAAMWLAVWAIARFTRTERLPDRTVDSTRSILDRRFASGQIDAEEYVRSRRALEEVEGSNVTSSP